MKTKILFLSLFLAVGCSMQNVYVDGGDYDETSFRTCPKVEIRDEDKAIVQRAAGEDLFQIEVVGYDGRCYYDERVLKNKAVVSPKFKITRLGYNHVEDVHFSYYLETVKGPTRFLGKKTYFAEAHLIEGVNEIVYTAKPGDLSIPAGEYDVDMYVGLNALAEDSEYRVK